MQTENVASADEVEMQETSSRAVSRSSTRSAKRKQNQVLANEEGEQEDGTKDETQRKFKAPEAKRAKNYSDDDEEYQVQYGSFFNTDLHPTIRTTTANVYSVLCV